MAATVTSFVSMFSDMGLATATLQRKELEQGIVSTLLFINIAVGLTLMAFTIAIAPVAAWVFGDQRVTLLSMCLALAIPIAALGAQHAALLGRAMRWLPIQLAYTLGQVAGLVIAVALVVFADAGYWALAAQGVVTTIVMTAVNWIACDWRPDIVCDWRTAKREIGFGLHLTGFNFANWFHRQFDNALIGWRWGALELGYYSRAYNLMTMPISLINGPIGMAVLPLLSRHQSQPKEWSDYYCTALAGSCFTGFLLADILYLNASYFIEIMLGPKWLPSAGIFSLLAISMFGSTPMNTVGWIYMSLARTDRMFRWGLFSSGLCILAFVIGLPFHARGVAFAYSMTVCLLAVPGLIYATRAAPVALIRVLRTIAGPLAVALATIFLSKLILAPVTFHSAIIGLLATSTIAGSLYLGMSACVILIDDTQAGLRAAVMRMAEYLPGRSARQSS
jgi:PST family polysaccharide transporter